ncbi:MAG: hypothetical protein GXO25_06200 [Euryarchaeota archaeon]|nr:hypothetical protein [Euryarchaeota archaeon]
MKRILSILLLFVLMIPVASASQSSQDNTLAFKYVNIKMEPQVGMINLTLNNGSYFALQFRKVIVGELGTRGHMPGIWSAELDNMEYAISNGTDAKMGRYVHVRMWKNVTLTSPMHLSSYPLSLSLDFYVSSKNYTKGTVKVDRNTLRYDVHITTSCPGQYVFLEHRVIYPGSEDNVYENTGHGWNHMSDGKEQRWMNFTDHAELGFGDVSKMLFKYEWYSDSGHALYTMLGNAMDISFVYVNTGNIVQDPYVHLPVPIYVPEEVQHIVSYFMDHLYSILAGVGVAVGIIVAPALLRKRRL